jgi:hypothetical protein
VNNIYILLIFNSIILVGLGLTIISYFKGIKDGRNNSYQPLPPNFPIDQSLTLFNDFLELSFLRYFNSILSLKIEKSSLPITEFITEGTNIDNMTKYASGFVTIITASISPLLKSMFSCYYNDSNITNGEKDNYIFNNYITDWFIYRVRNIVAMHVAAIGENNSSEHAKIVDSRIVAELEMQLYYKLNIMEKRDINQTKRVIKK